MSGSLVPAASVHTMVSLPSLSSTVPGLRYRLSGVESMTTDMTEEPSPATVMVRVPHTVPAGLRPMLVMEEPLMPAQCSEPSLVALAVPMMS